jgi:hypothetical protein
MSISPTESTDPSTRIALLVNLITIYVSKYSRFPGERVGMLSSEELLDWLYLIGEL